jgi:Mg2+/citrate symporter
MKTVLLIGMVALLLALDWAALHDILKGEPNLYAEYGMILFSIIVFGVLILTQLFKSLGGERLES